MNNSENILAEKFDKNAARLGSKFAIREKDHSWSYSQLLSRSEDLSDSLALLGVKDGCRVGLMIPNSGSFVASFFSIARIGGIISPLNIRFRRQELLYYIRDTSASALLVDSNSLVYVKKALSQNEITPSLVEVKPDGTFQIVQEGKMEDFSTFNSKDPPLLLQYTSGSTGNPKRVIRTQRQLLGELESLATVFDLAESDRFLGAAPFSHVNGMVRTMMTSMFVGGTLSPCQNLSAVKSLTLSQKKKSLTSVESPICM